MNDNDPDCDYGEPPDWAWDIINKHDDLGVRTSSLLSATMVLIIDAADILKHAGLQSYREQAMSRETISRVRLCADMIADAIKLSELCPSVPLEGIVTENKDGTLSWSEVDTVHRL